MKILILHRPTDIPGGDLLTVAEYAKALRKLDVEVDTRSADELGGDWSEYDFIHLWAACSPDWGLPVAMEAEKQEKPLIITPSWWGREIRQWFYGHAGEDLAENYTPAVAETLKRANVFFCCTMSEAVECWKLAPGVSALARMMGHPPLNVEVQEPEDYVLCLGRIEAHKNQQTLAQACKMIGVKLICAGHINHPQIADLAVQQGAEIREHLEFDEAMKLLSKARVHALPSFSETPGLANMEAAMLGVPGVMGTVGAEPEFFGDGGIYANPWDANSIAVAITQAWEKPRRPWATIPEWRTVAVKAREWMRSSSQ